MNSPVLKYDFNTASLGDDSSGNSTNLTNTGVTLFNDPERGNVASFDGNAFFTLPSPNVPAALLGNTSRSIAFWFKLTGTGSDFFNAGDSSTGNFLAGRLISSKADIIYAPPNLTLTSLTNYTLNTWHHFGFTYDGSIGKIYFDGIFQAQKTMTNNLTASDLLIGMVQATSNRVDGYLSEFQVFDVTLTDAEVSAFYPRPEFTHTPFSTYFQISWTYIPDSTFFRITRSLVGGDETTEFTTNTELEHVIFNLLPSTTYTLRAYSSTDNNTYTLEDSQDISTLPESPANTGIEIFNDGGVYDLTLLTDETASTIRNQIDGLLTTGSVVQMNVSQFSTNTFKVLTRGGISVVPDDEQILIPFEPTAGSSQSVTFQLTDTSSSVVTYDETQNTIVVNGITYSVGDRFVLDGKSVTVFDL